MSPPLDFSGIKKKEDPPSPAAKPLDFGRVNRPSLPQPAPVAPTKLALPVRTPTQTNTLPIAKVLPVVSTQPGSLAAEAFKEAIRLFPEIAKANESKIDVHLKQLLPMKVEVVIDWGDKHATTASKVASDVAAVVRQVSDYKLPELLADATQSITSTQSFFQKLVSHDVVSYKPRLVAARINLVNWLLQLNGFYEAALEAQNKVNVYQVSLSAAVAFVGVIADNTLDRVCHQRQMFLQQVSQQATFTVAQVKDQLDNLYAIKAGLDQLLDVTIPAYQNAKAH